jgi:hypothetical protein
LVRINGDFDVTGDTTIGGDIYCHDLHTSSGSLYLGNLHLTYYNNEFIVPSHMFVGQDMFCENLVSRGNTTTSGIKVSIDGDAASPAYTFDSNSSTGMYYIPGDYKALAFSMDGQEIMQMDRWFNVGIGMNKDIYRTRPFANLHVYDNGSAEIRVEGRANGHGDAKIYAMSGNSSSSKAILQLSKHSGMAGGGGIYLYHKQDGSPSKTFNIGTSTSNHYFRILEFEEDQIGYIGIGGVDNPQEQLHVNGNIQVDGEVYCDNVVPANGVSGWYDDGTNFRVTVINGIITDIGPTVSGGYSMS